MTWLADFDKTRDNNFDFLRLALSVGVIFSHSYLLTGSHARDLAGWTAVNFFFAISGYLITSSWLRCKGSWDYLRRRVLRIHPGFIVAVLFSFLIAAPLGADNARAGYANPTTWYSLLLPVFYFGQVATSFPHNPLTEHVVNGSLWTIPCEFLMYLLVMLVGWLGIYRRRWALLSIFVIAYAAHRGLGRIPHSPVSKHMVYFGSVQVMLRLLTYFVAGMTLRMFHDRVPYSVILFAFSLAVLLVFRGKGLEAFLPIFGVYAIFFLAYSRRVPLHHFGKFGDFSYGTYLYAFPIQQLILKFYGHAMQPLLLFALATPLTLLAAFCSWHLVEKRFLQLKRKPISK